MFTPIHEPIAVVGVYTHSRFIPKKFQWRTQTIPVTQITLVSDYKDGAIKKRLYSVEYQGAVYRLEFNRETEQWLLTEVFCE